MPSFTVDELLASIKARCLVPISQITFSDTDLLRFANEEIQIKMVPNILKVKGEFYVTDETQTITGGVDTYPIPSRAIGSKIRNLNYVDSNNNKYPLSRIELENQPYFQNGVNNSARGAFYVKNNDVVIVPSDTSASGSLQFSFYLAPNALVDKRRVGIISAIDRVGDGTTGYITISNSSFPSNFIQNTTVDFLQVKANFRTYGYDKNIVSVNPTTKQIGILLTDIPANLLVGDHIASSGECIIPQIPVELQSMLAQCVSCRLLEAMGDTNNLAIANKKLDEMEKNLLHLIDTRVEGNQLKLVNTNGLLASARLGSRRFRR